MVLHNACAKQIWHLHKISINRLSVLKFITATTNSIIIIIIIITISDVK